MLFRIVFKFFRSGDTIVFDGHSHELTCMCCCEKGCGRHDLLTFMLIYMLNTHTYTHIDMLRCYCWLLSAVTKSPAPYKRDAKMKKKSLMCYEECSGTKNELFMIHVVPNQNMTSCCQSCISIKLSGDNYLKMRPAMSFGSEFRQFYTATAFFFSEGALADLTFSASFPQLVFSLSTRQGHI